MGKQHKHKHKTKTKKVKRKKTDPGLSTFSPSVAMGPAPAPIPSATLPQCLPSAIPGPAAPPLPSQSPGPTPSLLSSPIPIRDLDRELKELEIVKKQGEVEAQKQDLVQKSHWWSRWNSPFILAILAGLA